jgi:Ca-activated chloride channel family protein
VDAKLLRGIALLAGILIVLVAAIVKVSTGGSDQPNVPGTTTEAQAPADAIVVSVAYSPEKDILFKQAFADFNARKVTVNGHVVFAKGENVSSGAGLDRLRSGTLQPVIWTPSSSLWGRLLTQTADVTWVPRQNVSMFRTPLVIAMWEDQAQALGWPAKPLGWADILAEAKNTQGWAKYGHPEWGPFRLGHTNPDFSTSGLSAVAAEYYAATGKTEGLTLADVESPAARGQVRDIQSSVVHYGDTTLFFAEQLAARGPAFASAVAMEETTLVDYNTRLRKGGKRLVAIYPKEGTFFSDNPLMVLDAPWVSVDQKAGAAKVVEYLTSPDVQSKVMTAGFRPSDTAVPLAGNLTKENGVDGSLPTRLLSLPEPKVLARIRELWHEDRKPADIVLVLDTSGSMGDEQKLSQAQEGLSRFVTLLSPRDRVALVAFSDRSSVVQPFAAMTPAARDTLQASINGLFADGGTAVYDATIDGIDLLLQQADPTHIAAEVVLTDGEDNKSAANVDDVIAKLKGTSEGGSVRVFTIAYGAAANRDALSAVAKAGGGKQYDGDPENINAVYTSISSFF